MASILNKGSQLRIYSLICDGKVVELCLMPDLNLNIAKNIIEAAKTHFIFQSDVEKGLLLIIEEAPSVKGQKEGNDYTDVAGLEEILVTDNQKVFKKQPYKVTKETLLTYVGIGSSTADKILAKADDADGVWNSKQSFKDSLEEFGIKYDDLELRTPKKVK